ncbi:formylglycine-generating enzyme family protein [Trichodesmium erythraeum 21-75]|nr:formylglycine-generating enzyme family protein [Trichodesmium erythraeum 21-75]
MSISNFIEGLQKANYDPTAREIAEIIWLWVKTLPDGELESLETDKKDAQGSESNNQIYSEKNRRNLKVNIPELPAKTNLDLYPKAAADKYLPKTDNNKKERYPLQVPDAPAIPNKQELGIALKSLRRKFPSSTEQELNEAKTIDFFAEQKIWMPIKQPTLTRRWLDLVLVIEVNNSLVIWKQTIKELRKFLQSLGIFRHIETRGLKFNSSQLLHQELLFKLIVRVSPEFILFLILSSQNQRIEIFHYDDPQMRPYSPEFIGATSGKTLILLVSDLVSSVWSRPETYTLLQEWGRKGMVNLLQLLPERLWLRTNLGQQKSLKLNASVRLTSNQNLTIIPSSKKQEISQDGEFKLPVLCLDPNILEEWSKLLMGVGNNQSVGYGIKPDNHRYSNFVQEEITATERVERFQEIASPNALRLAEHLSAVLVTLPVIRVIQYTMLPQFNQGHVAEVLMGGLFKPLSEKITPNINPDEIEFEFFDGVRDELLSGLTVDEITDVIEEVSSYLAEKMGISLKEFEALLIDSSKPENKLAKQVYPLAQVQAEVLEKLGGSYAYFANQIRASNTGSTNEIKDLIEFEIELQEWAKELEIELQEWSFETPTVNRRGEIVERTIHKAFYFTQSLPDNVSLEMVAIPSGTFTMGSPESEEGSYDDERPQHDVTVPSFFMGKYPVTQGQWRAIASRTDLKEKEDLDPEPSYFKEPYKGIDRWQRPVEKVTWYQAVEFCERLSKLTGRKYRLPSEAEWEYACCAGTTTPFYFGETINTDLANYRGTDNEERNWPGPYGDGPKGEYKKQTTPVGQFPANAFGLYDMHGNVWEWCADDSHDNYVGAPTDGSAWVDSNKDSSTESYTRLRGGSWVDYPYDCRSAVRSVYFWRDDHIDFFGFRLVCDGGRTL